MQALIIGQLGMSLSSVKSLLFSFSILYSISELMAIAPNLLILYSEPSLLFHLDLKYRTVSCFHSSVLSNYLLVDRRNDTKNRKKICFLKFGLVLIASYVGTTQKPPTLSIE